MRNIRSYTAVLFLSLAIFLIPIFIAAIAITGMGKVTKNNHYPSAIHQIMQQTACKEAPMPESTTAYCLRKYAANRLRTAAMANSLWRQVANDPNPNRAARARDTADRLEHHIHLCTTRITELTRYGQLPYPASC